MFKIENTNGDYSLSNLDEIFAMKALIESDCSILFKKAIIKENSWAFVNTIRFFLDRANLDENTLFIYRQQISHFSLKNYSDSKYWLNELDIELEEMKELLTTLGLEKLLKNQPSNKQNLSINI